MTHLSVHLVVYSVIGLIAALLLSFSADSELELAEKQVLLAKSVKESFEIVGDLEKFSDWFPGVAGYLELESGPRTKGKRYRETVTFPFIGNMYYVHTLVVYDPPRTIEFIDDSWLRLRYKLWFHEEPNFRGEKRTMMTFKLTSGLRTYWFQYLAASFFRFLYDQRLRNACFNVRMLVDHF